MKKLNLILDKFLSSYGPSLAFFISFFSHFILLFLVWYYSIPDYKTLAICGLPPEEKKENLEISLELNPVSLEKGKKKQTSTQGEGDGNSNITSELTKEEQKQWKELLKKLKTTKNLRNSFSEDFTNIINDKVPKSYVYREREYEDIIVKEVLPTLQKIDRPFTENIQNAKKDLKNYKERNKIIEKFRNQEKSKNYNSILIDENKEISYKKPILKINKTKRQNYLDKTIQLPKEEIFENFQDKFMNYDPNKGDLPIFIRELYYENLQRLAYFFSSDETYFSLDYLQESLNKEDFLKNSMFYLSELQGSKTATELLFIVENIYEIQQRTMKIYFQNKKKLQDSHKNSKQIRIHTIKRVIENYQNLMRKKNIQSYKDAEILYFQKRIEIIDYLSKNTPNNYRIKDTLFEKGKILWEYYRTSKKQKLKQQAIKSWQKISNITDSKGDFLYEEIFNKLKPYLKIIQKTQREELEFQVSLILNEDERKHIQKKEKREKKLLWN